MEPDDSQLTHLISLIEEQEEIEQEDEQQRLILAATAIAIAGAEELRQQEIDKRHLHRTYLRRAELLPNPRVDTPWQALHRSQSDRAFITTMGIDVAAFEHILQGGFTECWDSTPIPRGDVPEMSVPRPERRSLDAAGALGLVLHYLSSTMREVSLQQIFALVPSSCSRYLHFALTLLLETLRKLDEAHLGWPSAELIKQYAELVQQRHPLLRGAFGSVDGLNLLCQTSDDIEWENATYNGWLHAHFISSVIAFAVTGIIIGGRFNAPGSWHDSRVAQGVYEKLRTQTPEGYYLVADTAFPRGTQQIEGKICAPLKAGQILPDAPQDRDEVLRLNRQLLSFRQTAEWGMRAIQGSFGRLRLPLPIADDNARGDLLETCFRLHNLRTRMVGINQIQSVYVPLWRDGDQAEVWDGFQDMSFNEQIKRDRVSQYHVTASFE